MSQFHHDKSLEELKREARRTEVVKLYSTGHTYAQIAEKMRICVGTVYNDLTELRAEWKAHRLATMEEYITDELEIIKAREREACQAFEESRGEKTIKTVKIDPETKTVLEVITQTRMSHGDPAMLDKALKASAARRELLGLDKPKKVAATDADGNPVPISFVLMPGVTDGVSEPTIVEAPATH